MKSVSKLICLATFFVLHFLLHTQLRALAGHILAHATLSYTQVRGHSLATFFTLHSSFFVLHSYGTSTVLTILWMISIEEIFSASAS